MSGKSKRAAQVAVIWRMTRRDRAELGKRAKIAGYASVQAYLDATFFGSAMSPAQIGE
jgi:hypothetical protein